VQITIGMQNTARELTLEVDSSTDKVAKDLVKALESGAPLDLTDNRGRRVVVPASALAYVEIGSDEVRRVGFDV